MWVRTTRGGIERFLTFAEPEDRGAAGGSPSGRDTRRETVGESGLSKPTATASFDTSSLRLMVSGVSRVATATPRTRHNITTPR